MSTSTLVLVKNKTIQKQIQKARMTVIVSLYPIFCGNFAGRYSLWHLHLCLVLSTFFACYCTETSQCNRPRGIRLFTMFLCNWYLKRWTDNVMLLIFSRELLHTTKMGSQLTGPLSSCWNSTALTPGLSLVYKISFPCLYFYIATWSFDNRYISAGKHLIHKMFTLYTVFPLWSWWLAWKALNYVTYWIFLSGLDARGVPVITFQIDYNLRNIP